MRSTKVLVLLGLAACGGMAAGDGASDDDGNGPGGNVGFGGAQDIGEFRGILDRGEIPGPNTLDANGFFNEHFNPVPPTTCGGRLCLTPGLAVGRDWLSGAHQATLQIAINTNIDPSTFVRLPMNLVVVVDHSGSMASDGRLEKVKGGLITMIDNLKPEDRLAIISFDDTVTVDAPFGPTLDRAALKQVVGALQPRGGTNIHDGLAAGFEMLGESPNAERQNRVIFLSDGLATVGITDPNRIIEMATGRIMRGVGLTTIGVGVDFDVELMRGLAERGAGNFYFVEDASAATEVFTEELDYFMQPLGLDLKVEATAASGWTMGNVTGTRLWRSDARRGAMDIPAVFLASRTSQGGELGRRGGGSMIFVEMTPTTSSSGRVAEVRMSYRLPGAAERTTDTVLLDYTGNPQETLEEPNLTFAEMTERYAMYNMFLGLHVATQYAERDWNCAAAALIATRQSAVAWNEKHHGDPDIEADLMLVEQFLTNLRVKGATVETSEILGSCPNLGPGNPPTGWDDDRGHDHGRAYGCYSASKASGGWMVFLGLAVGALLLRRRRRR
ncbi:MAG: VWA domain-containing protein [Deltaproteobacteria bacterium]|nr:VWA domain-containing protein [Deltaproteobacteria bacterium]